MNLVIFILTILCIFCRPFGFKPYIYTSIGAAIALIFGHVDVENLFYIFGLVWDSTLVLISLIIICSCLDRMGFFHSLVWLLLGKKKKISSIWLFIFLLILCGILSAIFTNDGCVLILTPMIFAIFSCIKDSKRVMMIFLIILGIASDALSNPLVISNLTNIITANYFKLSFLEFFTTMFIPNLCSALVIFVLFYICFRKKIPRYLEFQKSNESVMSKSIFRICNAIILLFVILCFMLDKKIPLGFISIIFTCIFLLITAKYSSIKECREVIFKAPYGVILFSFGLYCIISLLHKDGFSSTLAEVYAMFYEYMDIFGVALISCIGANMFNNLPMLLFGNLSLDSLNASEIMVYAHLLACNIGAKMTPIGSLATLLWFSLCKQKNYDIPIWQYVKYGLIFSVLSLCGAIGGLMLVL